MAEGSRGLDLIRQGSRAHGLALLRLAEARYNGDVLEEQPYADWALPLREEALAMYLSIAGVLAEADTASGDHESAARRYLRMTERDPYSEHPTSAPISALRSAGHHGSAQRLYATYVGKMADMDVEPATRSRSTGGLLSGGSGKSAPPTPAEETSRLELLFEGGDHVDAAGVTAAVERCRQERVDDLLGEADADDAGARSPATLASLWARARRAVYSPLHSAARTPRTLLAASCSPWPLPPTTMPTSALPSRTARPTAAQNGG